MRIERVRLREIAMPLRTPFAAAHSTESVRRLLIVELESDGAIGYGEVSALAAPYYTEETIGTAQLVLESFLLPIALATRWHHPGQLAEAIRPVRRHYAAKAGLEAALWDLMSQRQGRPLSRTVGGTATRVPSGVAIGLERDLDRLLATVQQRLDEGYHRVKVKIEPGWDTVPLQAIRDAFGDIPLLADANASYTLADTPALQALDAFNLLMIEQPLAHDDLLDHAALQSALNTPVCLDESILSADHARHAVALGSCRVMNIKLARVGGYTEARRIHDFCRSHGMPLWVGGMLESGIGRLHNIALASLPGFTYPGDMGASSRYWEKDIITPEVVLDKEGYIEVPTSPGLGHQVNTAALDAVTVGLKEFTDQSFA